MIRAAAIAAATLVLAPGLAAADALERIRSTGEIRLAVRDDAPPLSYLEDGVLKGYSVDLCRRVAERLAEDLDQPALARVLVPVNADTRFDAVATGEADLLCGAASQTLSRRAVVDFSIPIFVDGAAVMTREGGPADLQALAGQTVGVRGGTTTEEGLRATVEGAGIDADIVAFETHAEAVAALRAEEIDAYFADQSILLGLARAEGGEGLQVSGNTLSVETQALAMGRGETELRLAVDRALSALWRSGAVGEIFEANFAPAQPGDAMRALALLAPLRD